MFRNAEKFSTLPEINISRSRFDRDSNLHTTFNTGFLYPIYLDEVLAGDTFDLTCGSTVRMTTPIVPVMDNCYLDTYFFFVPSRLCWNRWKEFFGEEPRTNWNDASNDDLKLPHIAFNKNCEMVWDSDLFVYRRPTKEENPNFTSLEGSLIDYFGLPFLNMRDKRKEDDHSDYWRTDTFNMLPFEAYNLIWNDFFRDTNTTRPCPLKLQDTSDTDAESVTGIYLETDDYSGDHFNGNEFNNPAILDQLCRHYLAVKPVSKFHDYFTSCLQQPQKHAPVVLPGFDNPLSVYTGQTTSDVSSLPDFAAGIKFNNFDSSSGAITEFFQGNAEFKSGMLVSAGVTPDNSSGALSFSYPVNMFAGLIGEPPNINDLRYAFALQNLFEKDARAGSRYIELLYSHFGVTSPDARLQRPEYLGGDRISINMEQVVQTSETSVTSPQGNVSGLSLTNNIGSSFTKSFTEPGYIIGVACIRPQHTYQNGINRMWSRNERFDFYYPALAHIGEQPVFLRELVAGYHPENAEDLPLVFGYQEPWAEYRYKPNTVTGKMRSLLPDSLDIWHYADIYYTDVVDEEHKIDYMPNLNNQFICENPFNVDRSLAISYKEQPQFYGDFYFKCACTRPMPLYSIPGLVDHH